MDLSQFDVREKAEAGVDLPLVINGDTVYGDDDQPVTFRVKGILDPEIHNFLLRHDQQSRTAKEVYASDMKFARMAVVGWSDNFKVEGEKYPFSKENIEKVLGNPVVRAAVLAEVRKERNFMNGS